MKIWDVHCHCRGDEKGDDVLRWMDKAGLERICLFSEYPPMRALGRGATGFQSFNITGRPPAKARRQIPYRREDTRAAIEHIASVQAADPERIYGLLWVEPRTPGIIEEIEYALVDRKLRGIKMIPDHWSPEDELLYPIYEKMEELGKPIQFHSGILYGFDDSSRFCRPALYEVLVHFPKLRFSLAHISWPWVDECLAVFGRFRSAAGYDLRRCQMWIDTCRGTPDAWRQEALSKAVPFVGTERLMFGVDTYPEHLPEAAPVHFRKDLDILQNILGLSQAQIEMFFWGAAEQFYSGPA
jgi:predicted TIM-barrel fold metal-dependent hydrolase